MTISMTGFGRAQVIKCGWAIKVEAKSVNNRYFDAVIRMPRIYSALEEPVLAIAKSFVTRGRVEIYISIEELADNERMVRIDKGVIAGLLAQWEELKELFPLSELTFAHLIQLPDVIRISEVDIDWDLLTSIVSSAVEESLGHLNAMRMAEGSRLEEDLLQRVDLLQQIAAEIGTRAPLVVLEYQEKLKERLEVLLQGTSLNSERFETEVAIFADRCSIDEELVRLASHIAQFSDSFGVAEPIGRSLDFLIQEMNREVNTIGSKANDLYITQRVLQLKNELERIREQVQNLE